MIRSVHIVESQVHRSLRVATDTYSEIVALLASY